MLVAVAARSLEGEADVSLVQYRTLVVLATPGPRTLVGLANELRVTPATATRMCDRLVRKRLIRRYGDRDDRRVIRIELTARGRDLVSRVMARRSEDFRTIVQRTPISDQRHLVHALRNFAEAAGELPLDAMPLGW